MLHGLPHFRHELFYYETNLPTFQAYAQTAARLSCAHEDQGRTRHALAPPPARAQAAPAQGRRGSVRAAYRRLTGCAGQRHGLMDGFPFPKPARLGRRSEFQTVRRRGRAWHGKFMVLSGWRNLPSAAPRLGVVASRKTGCAVERNRARRRLKEIFRLHRPFLPAGLWMVVVLRQAAVAATFQALLAEWRALCVRAGYLKT